MGSGGERTALLHQDFSLNITLYKKKSCFYNSSSEDIHFLLHVNLKKLIFFDMAKEFLHIQHKTLMLKKSVFRNYV